MYSILKRNHDREDEGRVETQSQRASEDKVNDDKQKEKLVSPPTEKELEELKQEYIVQCTKLIPQTYKDKGVRFWLICNLCEQYLETVTGARRHIDGMKHVEKKILKKFNEDLKLVGSPNEEQFDTITVKLQQVYDEWSAEACGQQTVREKIVSDFQEFVRSIKGCKSVVVELFGSTYTGFALKDSDINMNLRFRDHTINSSSTYDTLINGILNRLTTINDSNGDVLYTNLKNNLYSFVSYFTFTHRPSGLSCHVRYGSHHRMPICTGKLLQRYGAVDHRVKVLAVVLKYWAKLCRLDIQELGSYPSQMFVLMLVHFLQHRSPPLLPVPPKPNDFSETQQCLEHFDEYLSGLDHMIKSWKVSNTESLGMLWLGMFRYYSTEANFEREVIQVTQNDVLLKQNTSWSGYKLLVVLNPVNPVCNISRACSSRKMYLYFEACLKATWIYFGRAVLNKPSKTLPTKGCNNPQGATSCSDPCITKGNVAKPPCHVTYLTDVASQLSDFTDDPVAAQSKTNEPIRSENDYDSEQHNNTHLVVEDNEGLEAAQFEFSSSNFTTKKLPEVCSLCKQEDHTFTSPNCPSTKKEEIKLANHPPLGPKKLKKLDRVFIDLKVNICLKPTERMLRREICNIVEYYIKAICPDAELTVFGSSANGFGKGDSDIDINMKLPGNFEHDDNVKVIENVAHHLWTTPQQGKWWINSVQAVTSARVPLVKMTLTDLERWNSLECDISLGNSLALHNTELLASYASIDERVQVMGYVLKEFAKSSNMCDASTGSLSSYAYILLLLHYLQQVKPPVIPVLQQIGGGGNVDVDGWNCWFYRFSDLTQLAKVWPHIGKNKKTVGELLINFFKYYLKEFNWQKHVVCIRQLKPLSKLGKEWAPKQVCIEDPFNLDHNLSNHLNSKMWSYICNAFRCAHDHISSPQLHSQPLTIKTVLSVEIDKKVPQDGLCYTCGKRGHGYYNCPSGRHTNTCDLCGNQGHVKSQCPMSLRGYPPRYSGSFLPRPLAVSPPRTTTQPFLLPYPHMPSGYPIHPYAPQYGFNPIPNQHIMPASPIRFTPQPHGRWPMNAMPSYGPSQLTRPVAANVIMDPATGLDSSRMANRQEGNRGTTPQMHSHPSYYHDRQMH